MVQQTFCLSVAGEPLLTKSFKLHDVILKNPKAARHINEDCSEFNNVLIRVGMELDMSKKMKMNEFN